MRLIVMVLYGTGVRIEECVDLRVKDLDFDRLGHRDVSTTMIYRHVMRKGALGVRSPMDRLEAQAHEALAGIRLYGFPEMTRQRWRGSTRNRYLAWVFAIASRAKPNRRATWTPAKIPVDSACCGREQMARRSGLARRYTVY